MDIFKDGQEFFEWLWDNLSESNEKWVREQSIQRTRLKRQQQESDSKIDT